MKDYSNYARFNRHGGSYDRGSADSYYGRPRRPHYFMNETYNSMEVEVTDPDSDHYKAYMQGYSDNEAARNFKDWG